MIKKKPWAFAILTALTLLLIYLFTRRRSRVNKLLIVGNGFDLHHDIPSKYSDFRKYLEATDEEVYDAMEEHLYLQQNDQWNDFEQSLANLDAYELMDKMSEFLGSWSDEKASGYHDFQNEVGKALDCLGERMQEHFLNWVLQLPIDSTAATQMLALPKDGVYLNFNYTRSLEVLYGIAENDIVYIHGKAMNKDSKIVLGHGWEHYRKATEPPEPSYEDLKDGYSPGDPDWRVDEAIDYIDQYFESSYKNTGEIIKKNRRFFKRLKGLEEIYVMGHSMKKVDIKYFEEIVRNTDLKKVKWNVSYYGKDELDHFKKTLSALGVDINAVRFKALKDLF